MMRLAIVVTCFVVLLFDTTAASISKLAGIDYTWFSIPQLIMYLIMGFVLMRTLQSASKVLIALVIAAIVEGTLGWMISAAIGPGRIGSTTPVVVIVGFLGA